MVRVVLGVARRYLGLMRHQSVWDWEDLVQAGVLGAMMGVRDYDPERGKSLGNWVFHRIEEQVLELTRTGFYGYAPRRRVSCKAPLRHGKRVGLAADEMPIRLRDPSEPIDLSCLFALATPRQQDTIDLFYGISGLRLTAKEIAARNGVKKCTVESTIRDGLGKMGRQAKGRTDGNHSGS